MTKRWLLAATVLFALLISSCASTEQTGDLTAVTQEPTGSLTAVTLMLDWVPNVNHTGIYVAQDKGYFEEAGLVVEIAQPGQVFAEPAVASDAVEFGISFQEQVTLARADNLPLVSIAAIIQHNTSGFASRAEDNIQSPADWAGLRYGSFGSPFEEPTLQALMECAGGDFSQLEIVNTGATEPLALLQSRQVDLAWIFYGTQGVAAEQQGIDLDILMMEDYFDCIPDYYTPVVITSERMIGEQPDVVRAFLSALSQGYEFAANNPEEAASILLAQSPESGEATVRAQQAWLSPRYQDDAPRWGEQSLDVWENYSQWMTDRAIIASPIDAEAAFTNEFLP